MKRIPLICGDEYDVLTRARKFYIYLTKPGKCAAIKRKYNRRFRRVSRALTQEALHDG